MFLFVFVARLAAAAFIPLSADEAYYRIWSHALAPGYLDHPPMVALWIRAGVALAGDTPLGIRLLGPVSAWLGTILIADAATCLGGEGRIAAWLLNGTLLLNAGAVIMTPDTPLLFFWTLTLWALARLVAGGRGVWWLAAGAAAGAALASKYTAALLAPSLLVWLLLPAQRPWLRRPHPWAGAALALLVFAPVLAWNAGHGWVSFAKQGGREAVFAPLRALSTLAELLAGQIGLATPLIAAVLVAGVWRLRGRWREPGPALLLCLTLIPAAVFVAHGLGGDRVQANWPAPVYPAAVLAAALAGGALWRAAALSGLALVVPVYAQAALAPVALPRRLDVTLIRLGGWTDLAGETYVIAQLEGAEFVAADEYGLAAELAFRMRGNVVGAETRWALFALPAAQLTGRHGILLRSTRRAGPPAWPGAVALGTIRRARHGVVAETYRVFRVAGAPAAPAVWLRQAASGEGAK